MHSDEAYGAGVREGVAALNRPQSLDLLADCSIENARANVAATSAMWEPHLP
jgi:hypothetical protein